MQCTTGKFRNDVRILLEPLLKENSSNAVRNPVLLLNFLYQHQVICKPVYDIQPNPNKPFSFIGICSIGQIKYEAEGKSKKLAKSNASQKVLDHLLYGDTQNDSKLVDGSTKSLDPAINLYISNECGSINIENNQRSSSVPKFSNKQLDQLHGEDNFYEDDFTGIFSFENEICNNSNRELKTDHSNDKCEVIRFQCNTEENELLPPISHFTKLSTDEEKSVMIESTENNSVPCCEDFFDPFSQMRPRAHSPQLTSQISFQMCTSVHDVVEKFSSKCIEESINKNKTLFQLLQETSVKRFKLIPRSRIEEKGSGFICTIVIGTLTGVGEGRSKREAKEKAASYLLPLLEK